MLILCCAKERIKFIVLKRQEDFSFYCVNESIYLVDNEVIKCIIDKYL